MVREKKSGADRYCRARLIDSPRATSVHSALLLVKCRSFTVRTRQPTFNSPHPAGRAGEGKTLYTPVATDIHLDQDDAMVDRAGAIEL